MILQFQFISGIVGDIKILILQFWDFNMPNMLNMPKRQQDTQEAKQILRT